MNKKKILRCFSVLLALSMLMAMLPAGAYAADAWDGSIDVSWYNTTDTSFTITTAAQLAGLAAIVNGTAEGIDKDSFAGKTITLGADIDLGNRNWTPIGRRTALYVYDGFAGCFDGNEHTVSNFSVTDISAHSNSVVTGGVGLFGSVNGTTEANAEIKNLTLVGNVTVYLGNEEIDPADLTGFSGLIGIACNVSITDCIVSVTVRETYAGQQQVVQGMGGIVGYGEYVTIMRCANTCDIIAGRCQYVGGIIGWIQQTCTIQDCYNRGNVSAPEQGTCGGIVGYINKNSSISNCYNSGTVSGKTSVGAIFGQVKKKLTISGENIFYLDSCCSKAIGSLGSGATAAATTAKSAEALALPAFVSDLNNNGAWQIGLTFPILVCQKEEIPKGDISRSGIVDENDVTYLIGHVIGTGLLDPSLASLGDMNGDNLIDENDVTYLIQSVLHVN